MKMMGITALILFAGIVLAQESAPAALQGVVVRIDVEGPLPNANIRLLSSDGGGSGISDTTTDAAGRFFFPKIPPGTYRVVASRDGYVRAEYGQRRSGGPGLAITLAASERRSDLRVAMTPGGKISGRITDRGKPAAGAAVLAWKSSYDGRQRILTEVLSGITNDRGEYEIIWLPPGKYYVAAYVADAINDLGYRADFGRSAPPGTRGASIAAPQYLNPEAENDSQSLYLEQLSPRSVLKKPTVDGAETLVHAPMFFPDTRDPQTATAIDVQPGGETRGVNIDSPSMPERRIHGTLTGIATPVINARGGLVNSQIELIYLASGKRITISASQDKPFEFSRIFQGTYLVRATLGDLTGRAEVEVGNADREVAVPLSPGVRLSGTIEVEPQARSINPTGISALNVILRPDPWLPGSIDYTIPRPQANGLANVVGQGARGVVQINDAPTNLHASFTIPTVVPVGNYRVLVDPIMTYPSPSIPTGPLQNDYLAIQTAYVKSIRFGEVDVLKNGLHLQEQSATTIDIIIGTNPGRLEARVFDNEKQPVAQATVVLIPENPQRFHTAHKFGVSDAAGRVQLQGIAPGDYKIFAWEAIDKGDWQDPSFVQSYEAFGKPVHVDEGKLSDAEIALIPARR